MNSLHIDDKTMLNRLDLERKFEYRRWAKEIPFLSFPLGWKVKIMPPFGGAIIRFHVDGGGKVPVSVYLDCYDQLGYVEEPYWEIYPYNGDVGRILFSESDRLIGLIQEALNEVSE